MIFVYHVRLLYLIVIKLLRFNLNKKDTIIINHLLGKTFKLQEKYVNDKLIVLKYFFTIFSLKVIKNNEKIKCKYVIFDNKKKSKNDRENYLKLYSKIKHFEFISYEELLFFPSSISKLIYILLSVPILLLFFIVSQFFENKSSFALLIEYPCLNNLINKMKGNHKRDFLFFNI